MTGWEKAAVTLAVFLPSAGAVVIALVPSSRDRLIRALGILFTGAPLVVGIIIVVVISWVVAVFGMSIFHLYERWAGLPQLIVLFILFGCAGPKFDTSFTSCLNSCGVNSSPSSSLYTLGRIIKKI